MTTKRPCMLPKLTNLTREETIGQYHMLTKQLAAVDRDILFPTPATKDARKAVLRAQLKIIGMDRYQQASRSGEYAHGGFDSSHWVLSTFKSRDDVATLAHKLNTISPCSLDSFTSAETSTLGEPVSHEQSTLLLRVLDVGAIVHRFPQSVHLANGREATLDVVSIDLDPANESDESGDESVKRVTVGKPRVLQADFIDFSRDHLKRNTRVPFDSVVLSLCVNFEGCPWRRGEMLYYASRILRKTGLIFLVLPLQCVHNSRYCDTDVLQRVLEAVGLDVVSKESTAALLLWTAAKRESNGDDAPLSELASRGYEQLGKKRVIRSGTSRNNFSICLNINLLGKGVSAQAISSNAYTYTKSTRRREKACVRRVSSKKVRSDVEKPKKLTSNQRKRARKRAKILMPREPQRDRMT